MFFIVPRKRYGGPSTINRDANKFIARQANRLTACET